LTIQPATSSFRRVLRRLDLALFSVSAILVLDGLAAVASIGVSSFTWILVILVVFFIPYGLITAELGAAYPAEGGLFVWVRRAFGNRWAARSTWCYWVSIPLGLPSVYILFAGVLSRLFFPALSLGWIVAIAIGMTWLTVLAGILRLDVGKWLPNLGALLKGIIIFTLGIGGLIYAFRHGAANLLSLHALLPGWNAGLAFLPVIVFNFLGFELASAAGEEIKNPLRDVPAAILGSGSLIAFFYLFATLGILLVLPPERLSLLGGVIDTLAAVLEFSAPGHLAVTLLGVAFLVTLFSTMVTWMIGTSRMAAGAAAQAGLPGVFGWLHPLHGSPVGASLLAGLISTFILIVYASLVGRDEGLFWSLFAFASIVFLLPYLLLFPAFLKLRISDPSTPRPYRFPGGKVLAWAATLLCTLVVLLAILFFVWVPGLPVDWSFTRPVVVGAVLTLVVGEVLVRTASRLPPSL
jgi:amino acid transporter